MTNIAVEINVINSNLDDFYLQWPEIFWWQMEFNLKLKVRKCMGTLGEKDD